MTMRHPGRLAMLNLISCILLAMNGCSVGGNTPVPDTTTPSESFNNVIPGFLSKWNIPGAVVGLVKNEKLIYVEGFGVKDRTTQVKPGPGSLFRIASLSKPITSAAILKLVEGGLLSLDDRPFTILDDLRPSSTAAADQRIYDITVRDLLQHSGGFDRDASFDPMFRSTIIAEAMNVTAPAGASTIVSYMYGRALDFAPAARYAYSNFGYCVLGRLIERITGLTYETYIKESILAPMGITAMRTGKTRRGEASADEVTYYDYSGAPMTTSVFPDVTAPVEQPYGGFYLEAMDSHGAWLASAVDLLRFMCHVDGRTSVADSLTADSIALMTARPSLADWEGTSYYYGLGWSVRPVTSSASNWWHTGSLPGTMSLLVRTYNNMSWVVLFNSRPSDDSAALGEIDTLMWDAVGAINEWPTTDLFSTYASSVSKASNSVAR